MDHPGAHLPDTAARIIVVSGLPRSGTSMVMAMLEAGGIPVLTDGLRAPDVDNPRGYFEYEPVKRLMAGAHSWLEAAAGRAVKIVVPLVRFIPSAVACDVILLERDLDDILASQSAMLARLGRPVAAPDLLRPALGREWALARHHLESHVSARLLALAHASVIANPSAAAEAIAAFLARPLDRVAMAAAVDPGLQRQGRERVSTRTP